MTAASAVERLGALAGLRGRAIALHAPAGLAAFAAILLLAANDGGYFPPEWGWSGVALAWVAAVALVIGRNVELGRRDGVFLGILDGDRGVDGRVGALGRRRAGAGARGGANARLSSRSSRRCL